MTSVRTHLWFGNDKAVEAANFYAEHVPNSAVASVFTARTDPDNAVAEVVEFTVAGHEVIGLNAGPEFHLNEAFSFYLASTDRTRSTTTGRSSPPTAASPVRAAGARTGSASPGRSSPASSRSSPATTPPRPTSASARRC